MIAIILNVRNINYKMTVCLAIIVYSLYILYIVIMQNCWALFRLGRPINTKPDCKYTLRL